MTEKRFQIIDDDLVDNENMGVLMVDFEVDGVPRIVDVLNELNDENEQLKQSNERLFKDIDLALGFIRHKGYSLQDIKDYEDAKKEFEEDLAYYRKGDVE